jgi:hypothetical protein
MGQNGIQAVSLPLDATPPSPPMKSNPLDAIKPIDMDKVIEAERTGDFWPLSHADTWELKLRFESSGNVEGHSALTKWFLFRHRKSLSNPNY